MKDLKKAGISGLKSFENSSGGYRKLVLSAEG
ncbi:MAG: hypothetical protein ACJA2Y_000112 [Cycloclasticus pugetii]|jgi:hypothetical protein